MPNPSDTNAKPRGRTPWDDTTRRQSLRIRFINRIGFRGGV